MTKFKVGDVVERNRVWEPGCGLPSGKHGVVSRVLADGGVWVKGYGERYHLTESLRLVGQEDDPLPPAPESVRYYHWGYHSIHADVYLDVHSGLFASGPCIRINDKDNRGITIDADTALQLAHDLTRMAMEIKRKGKQNA